MDIEFIQIPTDQLEIFKQEDKYQSYLRETFLYSTKVTLHSDFQQQDLTLIMTKENSYLLNDLQQRIKIPMCAVLCVLKSKEHPEMVIITDEQHPNTRISTNTQNRVTGIISVLAYYKSKIKQSQLSVYQIEVNNLLYFERSRQDKQISKIDISQYQHYALKYQNNHIFGNMLINQLILQNIIAKDNNLMIHLAKINSIKVYLYTLQTNFHMPQIIQQLKMHQNHHDIQPLLYVRPLQYKLQLFFKHLPLLPYHSLSPLKMFQYFSIAYDKLYLNTRKNSSSFANRLEEPCLTLRMLCWDDKLVLREYRYKFLWIYNQINHLIYSLSPKTKSIYYKRNSKKLTSLPYTPQLSYFMDKIHHIGLLIYQFTYGRSLFDLNNPSLIETLKMQCQSVIFPFYLQNQYPWAHNWKFQLFLHKCILCQFNNQNQVEQYLKPISQQ